jgi:hypothetical protein
VKSLPRYLLMVLAFAGDSTTTTVITGGQLSKSARRMAHNSLEVASQRRPLIE